MRSSYAPHAEALRGTFEPQLIPKHARRLAGFDEKVLALYARGLPVREIQKFLADSACGSSKRKARSSG
jgi:transposase-like protein